MTILIELYLWLPFNEDQSLILDFRISCLVALFARVLLMDFLFKKNWLLQIATYGYICHFVIRL